MSDYIISIFITFVAIATPLALVPLLDLICPLPGHVLERHQSGMSKKQRLFDAVRRYALPFCEKVATSVTRAAGLRKIAYGTPFFVHSPVAHITFASRPRRPLQKESNKAITGRLRAPEHLIGARQHRAGSWSG